jgi:hypothetical protein
MALPTTLSSSVGVPGRTPPYKSSAGNFYAVIKSGVVIVAKKATDPTDSWSTVGAPNPGSAVDLLSTVQDGDMIHAAYTTDDGSTYEYAAFNMATDSWTVKDEEIEDVTNVADQPWISIAVRSDGDVVVCYAGDTDANMGDTKERVDVNIRTSGTWGGPVALDAGGDVHYGNPNVVKASDSDRMHVIFWRTTNTADPPTTWTSVQGRTVDPGDDSLSTVDTFTTAGTGMLLPCSNCVSYDDAGTERIIASNAAGTTRATAIRANEDGSSDIDITAQSDINTTDPYENNEVGIMSLVELSGDLHVLMSERTSFDLFYHQSTDDGATWSASEEIDAITVNYISANIYVRGTDTVMAYVYDDGGVQKYNEKVLIEGGADLIQPPLVRSFAVTRSTNY